MYYRGESKDYGETACVPSIFRMCGYSIQFEQEYFERLQDDFAGIAIFDSVKKDALKYEYYYLKMLGVFQHYGYNTRLLDISTDKKIALYFASSGNYNNNGRVYRLDDNKIREIHTPSAESILRKIKCIRFAERLSNRNIWQELEIPSNAKYTIENNLIVDYKMALKDVIGTSNENLRLNHQKGAFILFGHLPDDNGRLTGNYKRLDTSDFMEIDAKNKFINLIDLAIADESICFVTVYPDSEKSMRIVAQYRYLSSLKERNEAIFELEFGKFVDELGLRNIIADRLKRDANQIIKLSSFFYLLNIEFVEYCKETDNQSGISAYEKLYDAVDKYLT